MRVATWRLSMWVRVPPCGWVHRLVTEKMGLLELFPLKLLVRLTLMAKQKGVEQSYPQGLTFQRERNCSVGWQPVMSRRIA